MINPLDLTGMTILVSGASSGIGRSIAIYLSQLGAKLILVGRNPERLAAARAQLAAGPEHLVEAFDLSQADAIPGWLREVAAKSGPLHGIVHSAGMMMPKPLKLLTDADFTKTMAVNVGAALALTKGFRQKGVCAPPGSVVYISSVMGLVGQPGISVYSATKGALGSLARSLALELAREQIRVNCVAPAMVKTEMLEDFKARLTEAQFAEQMRAHPLGLGEPEDVASATAFLLSKAARWITGTTLVVDGGYTAQ